MAKYTDGQIVYIDGKRYRAVANKPQTSAQGADHNKPVRPSVSRGNDPQYNAERLARRVAQQGDDYEVTRKKPGFWDKLFGALNAPGVGARAVINNMFTDKDVNILGEMGKSLRGEETLADGEDLLQNLGWIGEYDKNASWDSKLWRGAAVLGTEIITDPTTFMTGGLSAMGKSKYAGSLGKIVNKSGVISKSAIDDLVKYSSKVAGFAGKSLDEVGISGQRYLAAAVKRKAREEMGEGFLRIKPQRYLGMDSAANIYKGTSATSLPSKLQDNVLLPILDKFDNTALGKPTREYLAEVVGQFAPKRGAAIRAGKVGAAQIADAFNNSRSVERGVKYVADEVKNKLEQLAKDSDLDKKGLADIQLAMSDFARNTGAIETRREMLQLEDIVRSLEAKIGGAGAAPGELAEMKQALKAVKAKDAAINTVSDSHLKTITDTVERMMGKTLTPKQRAGVSDIIKEYTETMQGVVQREIQVGKEIGENVTDLGVWYVPGVSGSMDKATRKAVEEATGKPLDLTRGAGESAQEVWDKTFGHGTSSGVDFAKQKIHDTTLDRLESGIETVVDLSETAHARISRGAPAAARKEFKDQVATLGQQLTREQVDHLLETGEATLESIVKIGDEQYVRMAPGLAKEVGRFNDLFTNAKKREGLGRLVGWYNNAFKKWALATPGFVSRNEQTNLAVLYINGGMNAKTLKEGFQIASGGLGYADDAVRVVGDKAYRWGDIRRAMSELGVLDGGRVADIDFNDKLFRHVKKAAKGDWFTDRISRANSVAEGSSRATAFLTAIDKGFSFDDAADYVNRILYSYDPKDLTQLERGIRNYIPFYTWIRRNLPQQVALLVNDPSKISIYGKVHNAGQAATNADETIVPDYLKDAFVIPFPWMDGTTKYYSPNLAFNDLQKFEGLLPFLGNEGFNVAANFRTLVDEVAQSAIPSLKVAVEIGLNRDFFYKGEVSQYDGDLRPAHPAIGKAIKAAGGFGLPVREDGAVMIPAETNKLLQLNPLWGNLMRWTDNSTYDYETGFFDVTNKQFSRIISSFTGFKTYPEETEKWSAAAYEQDSEEYRNRIKWLKDREMYSQEADDALQDVLSDEEYRYRKEVLEPNDPEYQQYLQDRLAYNEMIAIEKLLEKQRGGKYVDFAREAQKRAERRAASDAKWQQDYAAKQPYWDERERIANELRLLMEAQRARR